MAVTAATILVAIAVAGYLNDPLRKQLLELCGTAERVAFWAAFANVTVVLMPAIAIAEPRKNKRRVTMFTSFGNRAS